MILEKNYLHYMKEQKNNKQHLLLLIGCYQLYKIKLVETTVGTGSQEEILQQLEKGLFIQLTEKEYNDINNEIVLISDKIPVLKIAWDKIIERDSKYKTTGNKAITVYALLWIFHFDITKNIDRTKPIYPQIESNNTLFSDKEGNQFISAVIVKQLLPLVLK